MTRKDPKMPSHAIGQATPMVDLEVLERGEQAPQIRGLLNGGGMMGATVPCDQKARRRRESRGARD